MSMNVGIIPQSYTTPLVVGANIPTQVPAAPTQTATAATVQLTTEQASAQRAQVDAAQQIRQKKIINLENIQKDLEQKIDSKTTTSQQRASLHKAYDRVETMRKELIGNPTSASTTPTAAAVPTQTHAERLNIEGRKKASDTQAIEKRWDTQLKKAEAELKAETNSAKQTKLEARLKTIEQQRDNWRNANTTRLGAGSAAPTTAAPETKAPGQQQVFDFDTAEQGVKNEVEGAKITPTPKDTKKVITPAERLQQLEAKISTETNTTKKAKMQSIAEKYAKKHNLTVTTENVVKTETQAASEALEKAAKNGEAVVEKAGKWYWPKSGLGKAGIIAAGVAVTAVVADLLTGGKVRETVGLKEKAPLDQAV